MATLKVIVGFSALREDDVDTKAASIIKSMTGNANYPTPTPTLTVVQAALGAYETALAAASTGNPEKTAIKDQKRKDLEVLLKQLGTYVQLNCKNDLGILLSSGFDAAKPATPVGILPKPENFKVESGPNPGTVKISLDKIKGAKSYCFEYTAAPITDGSIWLVKVATLRTHIIDSLSSGKQYAFRVSGIGADPTVVYSDVINRFVS